MSCRPQPSAGEATFFIPCYRFSNNLRCRTPRCFPGSSCETTSLTLHERFIFPFHELGLAKGGRGAGGGTHDNAYDSHCLLARFSALPGRSATLGLRPYVATRQSVFDSLDIPGSQCVTFVLYDYSVTVDRRKYREGFRSPRTRMSSARATCTGYTMARVFRHLIVGVQ